MFDFYFDCKEITFLPKKKDDKFFTKNFVVMKIVVLLHSRSDGRGAGTKGEQGWES